MTVMKDVAIAKSEFMQGEKAVTKIQDFQLDDELFAYCCLPQVKSGYCIVKETKSANGILCVSL